MAYYTDAFIERLYAANKPSLAMPGSKEAWPDWRASLKDKFSQCLGMDALPSPRPALCPQILEEADCGSFMRKRVLLNGGDAYGIPCYVLIPKDIKTPAPAAVAIHGHGYGSRDIVGLNPDGTEKTKPEQIGYQKNFAVEIAKRGFVVVVPELLGFGDRRLAEKEGRPLEESSCDRITSNLLLFGQTMAAWRIYDVMRSIDYLETLPEVDKTRIGGMGISGGGLVSAFSAVFDERIRCSVVSGYANIFHSCIMAMEHCIDNFIPGVLKYAELPDLIALIAPRPLLIESGDADSIFPIEASREAYERIKAGYALLGAGELVDIDVFHGEHQISGAKAYDWLVSHV